MIESDIPARLDRLPWGRFHLLLVVALGATWTLDGLEVTLAGSVAGALRDSPALRLSNSDIGYAASAYLAGAVLGALVFGWMADRIGRRRLFFATLFLYAGATAATAFSWNLASFMLFRFLTGAGIGGEYSAINSTIQEFTPARLRGRIDLAINGTFWLGAALGAAASLLLLDPAVLDEDLGWRACFLIGAMLGLGVLLMRRWIPESPRWLLIHGRADEAERVTRRIEQDFRRRGAELASGPFERLRIQDRRRTPLAEVARVLLRRYRRRSLVCVALMSAQAFFYNAIFFTYALVLADHFGVPSREVGWYLLPFALGNFLGPVLLGPAFDRFGRRFMISATYAISGLLLAASGALFERGLLDATTQTMAWSVIFFFASAAASSAYLTVSEIFPLEIRALAIAVFYALGTGVGGVAGPALFGHLIDQGSRADLFGGYLAAAVLMLVAAAAQARWGVDAERRPLEAVAEPLSVFREPAVDGSDRNRDREPRRGFGHGTGRD